MKIALLTTDNRENDRNYSPPAPYFGTAPEALLQGLAALEELEVHVISCVQQPVTSPEKIAPNLFYHALHVPKLGWMRTGYQGCVRAVRRKVKELQPDLVHGQGTERDCAFSAVFSGFPNVLTIHGNMRLIARINRARPLSFDWCAARFEGWAVPRTDGVVCISAYTQEAVRAEARRTWVVPNAVDGTFFEMRRAPATPAEILCVGHIQVRKNQVAFLQALDDLAAQRPLRVVFAGMLSAESAYVEQFRAAVAQRPWCEYVGVLDRPALRARLSRATMLALPSLEDNCPMTVLEAMAAGVPVLAARVGGIPELIRSESNGLLCDSLDPESMRAAVAQLLDQPALAGQLAQKAQAEARERFHPVSIARQHLKIYQEVLNE